ncbi:MAG: zinc-binding dehydrogenase, partial [Proteobacteria bacterium]|nr:zinc-binding dehydrogenase [Pseudomonadota bacterium]
VDAAALTMAIETAYRYLAWLDVKAGQTLLVNGGGAVIGFAAVQMGLLRGAKLLAVAGESQAERLRALGATVVPYGEGLVERVRALGGPAPDLIFDAAPVNMAPAIAQPGGVLPDLVAIADGDPRRVMTCGDYEGASRTGVRTGLGEAPTGPGGELLRYDVLDKFGTLAAEGRFSIPIARSFALEDWRGALEISLSGRAHGKLMLIP